MILCFVFFFGGGGVEGGGFLVTHITRGIVGAYEVGPYFGEIPTAFSREWLWNGLKL